MSMEEIKEFLNSRTEWQDGHLVFKGNSLNIQAFPLSQKYGIGYANRLNWYLHKEKLPRKLYKTCEVRNCIATECYTEVSPHLNYKAYGKAKTKKKIRVCSTIFWHMDKFNMLDWRFEPPRHRRTGLSVEKY